MFGNLIQNLDIIVGEFNTWIIMDKALYHTSIGELFPHRKFVYLPPYSPFLNPIENCFSVLKKRSETTSLEMWCRILT